jgi:hypothetical protein
MEDTTFPEKIFMLENIIRVNTEENDNLSKENITLKKDNR